jgi:hypothetical protein
MELYKIGYREAHENVFDLNVVNINDFDDDYHTLYSNGNEMIKSTYHSIIDYSRAISIYHDTIVKLKDQFPSEFIFDLHVRAKTITLPIYPKLKYKVHKKLLREGFMVSSSGAILKESEAEDLVDEFRDTYADEIHEIMTTRIPIDVDGTFEESEPEIVMSEYEKKKAAMKGYDRENTYDIQRYFKDKYGWSDNRSDAEKVESNSKINDYELVNSMSIFDINNKTEKYYQYLEILDRSESAYGYIADEDTLSERRRKGIHNGMNAAGWDIEKLTTNSKDKEFYKKNFKEDFKDVAIIDRIRAKNKEGYNTITAPKENDMSIISNLDGNLRYQSFDEYQAEYHKYEKEGWA